jgi:hypothetical protein
MTATATATRYPPDELSANARRWLTQHQGPKTPATRHVLQALADHYADTVVLEGILRWKVAQRG